MKINKTKILKALQQKEDAIIDAIENLRDYLDTLEIDELSTMGNDFCDNTVDFIHENDYISLNDIRTFIDEDLEQ